jgi:hypothetical protein
LLLRLRDGSLAFVTGQLSRNAYLTANLTDYGAVRFINETLPPDVRVLALGDQNLYYFRREVLADTAHDHWTQLTRLGGDAEGIARVLRALGVTHIWVNQDYLEYSEENWKLASPLAVPLYEQFRADALEAIYSDANGNTVFRLR